MSSTIQVYTKNINIEAQRDVMLVTLEDVDASDFVSEFTVDEVLSAMDFSDVFHWAIKMKGEDNE